MVLPILRPVVHELRLRGFDACTMLRVLCKTDETAVREVFGVDFIDIVGAQRTPSSAMHTFCNMLLSKPNNDAFYWMIRAAKEMQDFDLANFIYSRVNQIYTSPELDILDRNTLEPLMTRLADQYAVSNPERAQIIRREMTRLPRLNDYFNRPEEETRLKDAFTALISNGYRGTMLVFGEEGIGKTWLTIKSIYDDDNFLHSSGVGAAVWLNVYQFPQRQIGRISDMLYNVEDLLKGPGEGKTPKQKILLILDDVFGQEVLSAVRHFRFDVFVIAITRQQIHLPGFIRPSVTIGRLTDTSVNQIFSRLPEIPGLALKEDRLANLVRLCSGLPLIARIMAKLIRRNCPTFGDIEQVYKTQCQLLPEGKIDENWDDERKTNVISKLLLIGLEDETEQFQQRYSTFLMFKEASHVDLRDLAIFWQCTDKEAVDQMYDFSDRSLARFAYAKVDMEQALNIHAYLYASLFRFTVTTSEDPTTQLSEHFKFRENLICGTNKPNKENVLHHAMKYKRMLLFETVLDVLANPKCNKEIVWQTCTHRANEEETDSTPLNYLLQTNLFNEEGSRLPIVCYLVEKMLVAIQTVAADFGKQSLLSTMVSIRDYAVWYKNSLVIVEGKGIEPALRIASERGHSEVVKLLLITKTSTESRDKGGWTPLMLASVNGHCEVVKLLLANKADIEARDMVGLRSLMLVSRNGKCDIAKLLLYYNADMEARDNDGWTPLMFASRHGQCEVVKLLLENNADIKARDNAGWTALMFASWNGHCDVAKLLLEKKADIDTRSDAGWTSLMFASRRGNCDVVKLLVDNKADVEARSNVGWTSLMLASENGLCDVAKLLLDYNADIEAQNNDGWTPLRFAEQNGHRDVVNLLVEARRRKTTVVPTSGNSLNSALVQAIRNSDFEIAKGELAKGADPSAFSDVVSCTPVEFAVRQGEVAIAELLLQNGADVIVDHKKQKTALMVAASSGFSNLVQMLATDLKQLNQCDKDGKTALMFAAEHGHETVLDILIKQGGIIDATDRKSQTALHLAILAGHKLAAQVLIENGANVNTVTAYGWTPLMMACQNTKIGDPFFVEYLLQKSKGNYIDFADKNGLTALSLAAFHGNVAVLPRLLQLGFDANKEDCDRSTPLIFAAKGGHCDVARLLLPYCKNVNHQDKYGRTALIYSSRCGCLQLAELLLKNGADVNSTDNEGWNSLMFAAFGGHDAVAAFLQSKGADATAQNADGEDFRDIAKQCDNATIGID